jgi:hypothetical protein
MMAERANAEQCGSRRAHDKLAGPEIKAEKAEEKTFCKSRRKGRIVSGVRTKIDKMK